MIEYRRFNNADPPKLVALWHAAGLGRGAAEGFHADVFEHVNFSQRYFDRDGLLLAVESETQRVVGFGHAGFGPGNDANRLATEVGVICLVLVHPEFRGQGIGRNLVTRLEEFLRGNGAETILAGPSAPFDPFYVGIYGGSQPSGFLESDEDAAPFLHAVGYEPIERIQILQKDLQSGREPMNMRMLGIRRKTELVLVEEKGPLSWWWVARFGRLETLRFGLMNKADETLVASVTIVGLDLYLRRWGERTFGLVDLHVPEEHRRQGYGQTLLLEISKRLKVELVSRLEAHVSESNAAVIKVFKSAGFGEVDAGVVYRKIVAPEDGVED